MGEKFVLQFSTGESVLVRGTGLIGRAPVTQPGEYVDLLLPVYDPARSISKTHLEFGQEDGVFWIIDRWSGNGTVLHPLTGPAKRCEPGKRVRVDRGARVALGDQFFTLG
jgi:predicted component of type VI protein secretion system